jgi:hypothetical protein
MFDKRLLKNTGVFGPRREKVTGGWGKFHHEDLHVSLPTRYYEYDQIQQDELREGLGMWFAWER